MSMKRWQGLRALVSDAVEHGATAIERVHLETARRPFTIIEQIPELAQPAQNIREVHDTIVSGVYTSVRLVNQLVGKTLDAALAALDDEDGREARAAERT
jgi:hypothetical protein